MGARLNQGWFMAGKQARSDSRHMAWSHCTTGSSSGPIESVQVIDIRRDVRSGWEPAHCAGITLQFVRPDIRQSCILLVAVSSRASHNPTTSRITAIASPAIAPRRFPPRSGSVIGVEIRKTVDAKYNAVPACCYHSSAPKNDLGFTPIALILMASRRARMYTAPVHAGAMVLT